MVLGSKRFRKTAIKINASLRVFDFEIRVSCSIVELYNWKKKQPNNNGNRIRSPRYRRNTRTVPIITEKMASVFFNVITFTGYSESAALARDIITYFAFVYVKNEFFFFSLYFEVVERVRTRERKKTRKCLFKALRIII